MRSTPTRKSGASRPFCSRVNANVRHTQNMVWIYLAIAIVSEVIATSALKAAEGFTRWVPSLLVIVGYASAFYFLSLTLRILPVGVAYAIWSGVWSSWSRWLGGRSITNPSTLPHSSASLSLLRVWSYSIFFQKRWHIDRHA